ncbi:MAG: DNA polymerase III subunit gamma/tau [Gemmatimonadaceae bacterium]|nr:DNA polymerase III subunit gamma/tau [Gemmatimonadaceae bacterium]
MSLALARKYRPKTFADVAVQSHVSNTLRGAIARQRVAHGYLLCGPRGVGKTTLARVLAMALNCERKRDDGEPCGECTSCTRTWSGSSSLDVIEIDAASNRGVDDARDLRERAMYAPSGDDRYKVYIVDEAHMLTREAWNALLKILEEPPPRVIFVFATTEPQKIAQTAAPVLSRLQRFDLKRIGPADITRRLATVLAAEDVTASSDALGMIARAADGSMRDALSLTDQVISIGTGPLTAERVREALGLVPEDEFIAILDIIGSHRAGEIFTTVNRLADAGVDFGVFLAGFADILRAQLTVVLSGKADGVSTTAAASLAERKNLFSAGDLLRMISAINALEPTFRKSGQQQLLVEMLLVRMALLDKTVLLEDMLAGLGNAADASAPSGGSAGVGAVRSAPAYPPATPVARSAARPPNATPRHPAPPVRPISVAAPSSPPDWAPAPTQAATDASVQEMKRAMESTARDTNRSRMTPEALREERLGVLRQKDPGLGAAIDALDLELLD